LRKTVLQNVVLHVFYSIFVRFIISSFDNAHFTKQKQLDEPFDILIVVY